MTDFLLSMPTWVGAGVSMLMAAVAGLTVYLVFWKFISKHPTAELRDPTSNLFRVVGLLVGLMLSLAFAEVLSELRTVENAVEREAAAASDTFYDLLRFDDEGTREARSVLIAYVQAVIDDDWPALADDRLGQRAGALRSRLVDHVLALKPATPVQEKLWSAILADVDAMSDYRLTRLDSALAEPPIYLKVVFFGFLVTMACFGVYRPQAPLIVLVVLYTVFVGLVLYLILALSDPFQGQVGVDTSSFKNLIEVLQTEEP